MQQNKQKNILVLRLSAMGDVAMTVPVLKAFSVAYPNVQLTVVSRPFFKPFFKDIPTVVFFEADFKNKYNGFLGVLKLFFHLKKQFKITEVADLHNVLRTKIIRSLFAITGTKIAFTNKGRAEKKALTREKNKIFTRLKPMIKRHCDTFNRLGFPIDLSQPKFSKKQPLSTKIVKITGSKNKKWIGIAPFAQYTTKIYPTDLMQKVIACLAKNTSFTLFLFGGKNEQKALQKLQQKLPNVISIAGKLTLSEELDVISHLDVMLSMDSGNAHIAAMLGVKTITIWGATHPFTGFSPFHQPNDFCITPDVKKYPLLPTSVYGNKTTKGYENVMRTIPPEKIVAKIKETLS